MNFEEQLDELDRVEDERIIAKSMREQTITKIHELMRHFEEICIQHENSIDTVEHLREKIGFTQGAARDRVFNQLSIEEQRKKELEEEKGNVAIELATIHTNSFLNNEECI